MGYTEEERVRTDNIATEIVQLFEDLLERKGIVIPCDDETEEADRRDNENAARLYGMEYYSLLEEVQGILLGEYHKEETHIARLHFTEFDPPADDEALECDIVVNTSMTESELRGVATAIANIVYHANMGEPLSEFYAPDNWDDIGWNDKIRMVAEHMSELIGSRFCVEAYGSVNAICVNEIIY